MVREPSCETGVLPKGLGSVCLGLGLLVLCALGADQVAGGEEPSTEIAARLAPEVERMVARTKPIDWEMTRACLYYAFAGQRLLAHHGVAASLWVGSIVYAPETTAAYRIRPHAWLETATDLIDYSTLPRWGKVMVIPHGLVASGRSEVNPGVTRVLVLRRPEDLGLLGYLTAHRERFELMVRRGESATQWPQYDSERR